MKPTIGRVVYYRHGTEGPFAGSEDYVAAMVCWASEDGKTVNLLTVSHDAVPRGFTDVPFVQDGERTPENGRYAHWMPFQVGQAAKTQEAEGKLAARLDAVEGRLEEGCGRFEATDARVAELEGRVNTLEAAATAPRDRS